MFYPLFRGNLSHEAFLRNARNSEETLRKEAIERTDISHLNGTSKLGEVTENTVYQVESTGAVVSLNSAVGLIHFYCSQLPSDRFSFFFNVIIVLIMHLFSTASRFLAFCSFFTFFVLGTQYFALSLLCSAMRSQEDLLDIHAGFSFPVMHHLRNLRVLSAAQCVLHNRHDMHVLNNQIHVATPNLFNYIY